jgi:hypothetical protein
MSKREAGQGLVEYTLILVLTAVVVIVIIALIQSALIKSNPPAMDAALHDIVQYCDSQSAYRRTVGKVTTTHYDTDKFIVCMQQYEYRVTR